MTDNQQQQLDQANKKAQIEYQNLLKEFESFKLKTQEELQFDPKFQELTKNRRFWNTQPVLYHDKEIQDGSGPLIPKKTKEELEKPIKIPDDFTWIDLDLNNDQDLEEIYQLLYHNYVEDSDGCFRFNYSKKFLQWALLHPGYKKELFFGIKDKDNQIIAFISGIVLMVKLDQKAVQCTEVNFLCVKRDFRHHYIASSLIKEVVRRSNLLGVWQGIYTSGTLLPTPISQTRYFHRQINFKKLVESNFSYLAPGQRIQTRELLLELPNEPQLPEGIILRPAEVKDHKQIKRLLDEYLKKFKIYPEFSKKEASHWFTSQSGVLEAFVLEKKGQVLDYFSYYSLPSTILNNPKHKELRAAYAYYFAPGSMSLDQLMEIALIKARDLGYDVFNCLNIMDFPSTFEKYHFTQGDGFLQYYIYNWKLKDTVIQPYEIGMILM